MTTTLPPTSVTMIGLGNMGSALAHALLAAGHTVTVWNRTAARQQPVVAAGATAARTVGDAVTASPLVITCLTDFDQTMSALAPAAEQLAGRDLVTLNTGSPAGARATAAWATARGARFLAGAVKDVPDAVGAPGTLLYYSGDRGVYDDHLTLLRALGGDTDFLGDEVDLAAFYELSVGAMLLPALMGFFQGAAALGTRGRPAASMVRYAEKWLDMIRASLPELADRIDRRDYTGPSSTIDLFLALEAAEQDLGRETGVDVDWQAGAWERLRRASALGYGTLDVAAVTEVLRPAGADTEVVA
jgi:3-hydroxyisobutyrate dehydrogenase-like beta-hydroxyacid dehydrogenase